MYAGHAGLALLATSRRPRVPIALLVPVAFAPDWIEWMLGALGITQNPSISHSLVSVVFGATVIGAAYWGARRSFAAAAIVWLTYLSHWPADFITALKPIWPNGHDVGLNLYQYPVVDVVVESVFVIACWVVYQRSLSAESRRRRTGWLIPAGLVALQIGFVVIQIPKVTKPIRQMIALPSQLPPQ